jgi:hypothetical protein
VTIEGGEQVGNEMLSVRKQVGIGGEQVGIGFSVAIEGGEQVGNEMLSVGKHVGTGGEQVGIGFSSDNRRWGTSGDRILE